MNAYRGIEESTKKSGVPHQSRRYLAWAAGRCSSGSLTRRFAATSWFSALVYL